MKFELHDAVLQFHAQRLRLKTKAGASTVDGLTAASTLADLLTAASRVANIEIERVSRMSWLSRKRAPFLSVCKKCFLLCRAIFAVKAGFPPKPLARDNLDATLRELKISNGDVLICEESAAPGIVIFHATCCMASPKSAAPCAIAAPLTPRPAVAAADAPAPDSRPSQAGYGGGSAAATNQDRHAQYKTVTHDDLAAIDVSQLDGVVVRRVVPADNSCLFNSLRYRTHHSHSMRARSCDSPMLLLMTCEGKRICQAMSLRCPARPAMQIGPLRSYCSLRLQPAAPARRQGRPRIPPRRGYVHVR
jgi:hypothetical protein